MPGSGVGVGSSSEQAVNEIAIMAAIKAKSVNLNFFILNNY